MESTDLISGLLDTLGKVVHCGESASQADISYLVQLLMSVLDNLATHAVCFYIILQSFKLNILLANWKARTERDQA